MEADEKRCAGGAEGGAELGQLGRVALLGGLDLEIDDVAAGLGGFEEDFELRVEGAGELAAIRLAAAGGDGRDVAAAVEEGLDVGQDSGGLGQGVETELNENRVFDSSIRRARAAPRGWLPGRRYTACRRAGGAIPQPVRLDGQSCWQTARGILFN